MSSMYEVAEGGRALYEYSEQDMRLRAEDLIERLYVHDEHAADSMAQALAETSWRFRTLKSFIIDLETLLAPYEEI